MMANIAHGFSLNFELGRYAIRLAEIPNTAMTESNTALSGFREEIDRIDDEIQDLLMRRTNIASNVG